MSEHLTPELNKLERYLKEHNIPYERKDKPKDEFGWDFHKICVPSSGDDYQWDAICHRGSYGYEEGKIEIYGSIVFENDGDSVVGWLTAEEVIERIERGGNQNE